MNIHVEKKDEKGYSVSVVPETGMVTQHTVTIPLQYSQMLTGGKITEESLITKSFEFLLTKESNEAILPEFDLTDISQYFPEYEQAIKKGL